MKRKDLLLTKLTEYSHLDASPFHMPGHKRRVDLGFFSEFPNPFSIDITEIEGFDNLHHPQGILKESMEWAARVYGADKSYYLVNGSTSGILSAISATTQVGGKILLSRNAHKSAYHGVILRQLNPTYIYPQVIGDLGIQGGISPKEVEKALKCDENIKTVFLVSPTYDGIVSDVASIGRIVHAYGGVLIVDEAHGAHFPFGREFFPKSALELGADVVIQSLHKTLPSFTQTAILHIKSKNIEMDKLERYLQIYQSSSPSYVFMAGIERCIYEMVENGPALMEDFYDKLCKLRESCSEFHSLHLLNGDNLEQVFDYDKSKIVVSCRGCMKIEKEKTEGEELFTGAMMADWLRKNYRLEMEMCGADYVVAITSCYDTGESLERLSEALLDLDNKLIYKKSVLVELEKLLLKQIYEPLQVFSPYQLEMKKGKRKRLEECAGNISKEFIYLYPPGIPLVVPGEQLTKEMLSQIGAYKRINLPVQGMEDERADYLWVVE